jgi:hypothetical protein
MTGCRYPLPLTYIELPPFEVLILQMDRIFVFIPYFFPFLFVSLVYSCNASKLQGGLCDTWSLVGGICSTKYGEAMTSMSGCKNYNVICDQSQATKCNCTFPSSTPPECNTMSPKLPPTMKAQQLVHSICSSKALPACSKCAVSTSMTPMMAMMSYCKDDPLDVLSDLCTAMPSSPNCTDWSAWCAGGTGNTLDAYCRRSSSTSSATGAAPAVAPAQCVYAVAVALLLAAASGRTIE